MEPLFDGVGVPVEDQVGEDQVPDAVYACTRGSKPPRTLSSFPLAPERRQEGGPPGSRGELPEPLQLAGQGADALTRRTYLLCAGLGYSI